MSLPSYRGSFLAFLPIHRSTSSHPSEDVDSLFSRVAVDPGRGPIAQQVEGPEKRGAARRPHVGLEVSPSFPVGRNGEDVLVLDVPRDLAVPATSLLANRRKQGLQRLVELLPLSRPGSDLDREFHGTLVCRSAVLNGKKGSRAGGS